MRSFFDREIVVGIKTAHFTGDLNGKIGGIKRFDSSNSAFGVPKSIPQFVARITKRRQASESTDDDAAATPVAA
jgi:hypothetical protein